MPGSRIHLFLLMLAAFLIPVGKLVPLPLALLGLHWLVEGSYREKLSAFRKDILLLLPCLYYFLHLIGMAYSSNTADGWFDLEVKLPLLLYPFLLAGRGLQQEQLEKILRAFVYGCLSVSVYFLGCAILHYFSAGENHFFYEAFSQWHHPSYLAMYLSLGIVVLFFTMAGENKKRGQRILAAVTALFFSLIVFLLSSKAGILVTLLSWLCFPVFYMVKRKRILQGIVMLAAMTLVAFLAIMYVPQVSQRLQAMKAALENEHPDESNAESNAVRLQVWKAGMELAAEHLAAGTGTGDVRDALLAKYREKGITGAYTLDAAGRPVKLLNAHNQFLQSCIALGLAGLLLSLACFLPAGIAGIRRKNLLMALFILITFLNFLTESMLEREAGVMFFGFFYAVLSLRSNLSS